MPVNGPPVPVINLSNPMATPATDTAQIPAELKPADGRFGCGPSKVRPQALAGAIAGYFLSRKLTRRVQSVADTCDAIVGGFSLRRSR